MKLLMLDGPCEGQMFDWPDSPPVWRISRRHPAPLVVTVNKDPIHDTVNLEYVNYALTFRAVDRDMALYSLDGASLSILRRTDLFFGRWNIGRPIYANDLASEREQREQRATK